jgi:ubiquinone/menaquinone biosynthesis C-methylase UbiE
MDKKQKAIFLQSEADKWFDRNLGNPSKASQKKIEQDRIILAIDQLVLTPQIILEIGCSNGWRLEALRKKFGCECHGIDPSAKAIESGKKLFPSLNLQIGTADELPFVDNQFDNVIVGFCLYLCDREDLFKIAYQIDRVLRCDGSLLIMDFYSNIPYSNPYHHADGVLSYKMDYSNLFLWNPFYTRIYHISFPHGKECDLNNPGNILALDVLRKSTDHAYPKNPFLADGKTNEWT